MGNKFKHSFAIAGVPLITKRRICRWLHNSPSGWRSQRKHHPVGVGRQPCKGS